MSVYLSRRILQFLNVSRKVCLLSKSKCTSPVTEILCRRNYVPVGFGKMVTTVPQCSMVLVRKKYTKKTPPKVDEEESDSDEEMNNETDEKDSKVIKTSVNSLRADLLIKVGLGIARNKIENIFYESRIRVNGKKIPKKSQQLNINDEIDVIKGFSNMNPEHLIISRIIVLSASENEENISVRLRRYKHLIIENYEGSDAYRKSSSTE